MRPVGPGVFHQAGWQAGRETQPMRYLRNKMLAALQPQEGVIMAHREN